MDNTTLGAAIGIMLGIENTDIARAEAAAQTEIPQSSAVP